MYWLDPNGGRVEDAIPAFCDMRRKKTCIRPVQRVIPTQRFFQQPLTDYTWLGEETDLGEVRIRSFACLAVQRVHSIHVQRHPRT